MPTSLQRDMLEMISLNAAWCHSERQRRISHFLFRLARRDPSASPQDDTMGSPGEDGL